MTLIELLVVIVILTTLVAGVIPVLSPNNDTRKIREATRMLQTYIMRAQTEAARTGRPQGIAFRESSAGSGVALDVFRVNVPAPFAGFSEDSRVELLQISRDENGIRNSFYGDVSSGGNKGTRFSPKYLGAQLYGLRFVVAGSSPRQYDPFPPRMFRIGDLLDVGGNTFLIVDDEFKKDQPNRVGSRPSNWPEEKEFIEYLIPADEDENDNSNLAKVLLNCVAVNDGQGPLLPVPEGEYVLKRYQFLRQPATSIEPPLQFPAGIAIDMQASIAEGGSTGGFLTDASLDTASPDPDTISIMFSPTGSVSEVMINGNSIDSVSRIALLLGRVENGGLATANDWKIASSPSNAENASNDDLAELQAKINWLNLDSRWLSISTSSGRAVTNENAFVDTRDGTTDEDGDGIEFYADPDEQIEAAHEFAHAMRVAGAGR